MGFLTAASVLAIGAALQGKPIPITERAIATLTIPGFADFLTADGRDVWTTNEHRVEKLRHDRARPVGAVAVPEPCGGPVVAFGSLWVANCSDSTVYRIDRSALRVAAVIRTGIADGSGELTLAAGAGSVWVLTSRAGVLSRIDPKTNRIVARIMVAPSSFVAAFGFGSVWVTNTNASGSVQRIDPATNRVTAKIAVGPTPRFMAAGEGAVWTLNQGDGSVTRIDPVTNRVAATIPAGIDGAGGDIATGAGRVWVRGKKTLLVAIDAATNREVERYGPNAGSGGVRVAGDLVWVTAHDIHAVWVLRPGRMSR